MTKEFSLDIKVDNSEEVLEGLKDGIERALEAIGIQVENYAKELCPVDTGNLRNSITHAVEPPEEAVYVGSAVEYAAYVELGHQTAKGKHIDPQPYLEPAVMDHVPELQSLAEEALKW